MNTKGEETDKEVKIMSSIFFLNYQIVKDEKIIPKYVDQVMQKETFSFTCIYLLICFLF